MFSKLHSPKQTTSWEKNSSLFWGRHRELGLSAHRSRAAKAAATWTPKHISSFFDYVGDIKPKRHQIIFIVIHLINS